MPDDIRKPQTEAKRSLNTAPPSPVGAPSQAAAAWRQENAVAIADWNDWVERHGMPLSDHRQF